MPDPVRIYRSLDELDDGFGPCALTIGNFDGMHAGHRAILRRVVALGRERGWKPSALTFDPHPLRVVAPSRAPKLLSRPEERVRLMAGEGIEQVLVLPFTRAVSQIEPEAFIRDIVARRLGARAVIVGANFRFGHRHAGDTRLLAEVGRCYGFLTEALPALRLRGRIVSSSEVRRLIAEGRVSLACRLLGRPYTVSGDVVAGRGIGSRRTVPTLNLPATVAELLPAAGIYVTRTADLDDRRRWPSVTYIGNRPTLDSGKVEIETFLLDPLEPPSPRRLELEFLYRLRDDRKFDTVDQLRAQILRDVARAKKYFQSTAETRRRREKP